MTMSANKILIADDDKVVHESLGIYLKSEGFEVVDVYDGKAAVAALDSDIALCVLDIMMPEMSGLDVCREIRKTSRVPVIMLTAKGEEIDRILGLELGADDYIVKPFSPREVVARIKAVCAARQSAAIPRRRLRYPSGAYHRYKELYCYLEGQKYNLYTKRDRNTLHAGFKSRPGIHSRAAP